MKRVKSVVSGMLQDVYDDVRRVPVDKGVKFVLVQTIFDD